MTRYIRRIRSIDYQRNGVAGAGFYEVRFRADAGDECIAAVFYSPDAGAESERGYCAVMTLDGASRQAWRGDVFEPELWAAIDKDYRKGELPPAGYLDPVSTEDGRVVDFNVEGQPEFNGAFR